MSKEKPLFKNGTEVIFANTQLGPSLYSILEGAWMLPALIQGIRSRVWEEGLESKNPIAGVWFKMGLFAPTYTGVENTPSGVKLSEVGERIVACAGLLEYEFGMIQQQLDNNFETDPSKYADLRKGLAAYTRNFMGEVQNWVSDCLPDGGKMFDFCGGSGEYLIHAMLNSKSTTGILFDKAPGLDLTLEKYKELRNRIAVITGNAKEDHPVFEVTSDLNAQCDLVLMSEILHCMSEEERKEAIRKCFNMLKIGGKLIVIEQFPSMRLDWRLFNMTDNGVCLPMDRLVYEVQAFDLKPVGQIEAVSHYGVQFEKQSTNEVK